MLFYGGLQLRCVGVVDHYGLRGVRSIFGLGPHGGVWFPLLFRRLGAPEVCGGDQILGAVLPVSSS